MHKPPFKPVPILPITDAPGYLEAVAQEQSVRDCAFLRLNEKICGFEVRPLLYRQYLFLRFIRSPLLFGRIPEPLDLARFLWMLSPEFSLNKKARDKFLRRCRSFMPIEKPIWKTQTAMAIWKLKSDERLQHAAEIIGAALKFVDEQLIDLPKGGREFEKDFYSDTCYVVNFFWREFQMCESEVMELPMNILIQKMRETRHHHAGNKAGLGNRSDENLDAWIEGLNRNIQPAGAN